MEHFPLAATIPFDLETESHIIWGDLIQSIVRVGPVEHSSPRHPTPFEPSSLDLKGTL
jgi:hypothetical protein